MGRPSSRPSLGGSGQMLPAAAYTDPEVLAWENEHVFAGGWICLGRADDLAEPGDRRAYQVGTRGSWSFAAPTECCVASTTPAATAATSCFPCGGEGPASCIRCPYHAWVFTTEGRAARCAADPRRRRHRPLASTRWFRSRSRSGTASSWSTCPETPRRSSEYFDRARRGGSRPFGIGAACEVADTHSYTLDANWKLIVENYHECFHCPTIHPELCRVSDTEVGRLRVRRWALHRWRHDDFRDGVRRCRSMARAAGSRSPGFPTSTSIGDSSTCRWAPTCLVSLHPDYVMIHRLVPLAPDRTFVECHWLFPQEAFELPGLRPLPTPSTSGTSPTGRTGPRARASSAAWQLAWLPSRSVLVVPRGRCTALHRSGWPQATSTGDCAATGRDLIPTSSAARSRSLSIADDPACGAKPAEKRMTDVLVSATTGG